MQCEPRALPVMDLKRCHTKIIGETARKAGERDHSPGQGCGLPDKHPPPGPGIGPHQQHGGCQHTNPYKRTCG